MKFKQYLNEGIKQIQSLSEFNKLLHNKCSPYLKIIKNFPKPFYRGMSISGIGLYHGIKDVRSDRNPRGTVDSVFKELNKWLQNKGHNRRDQSFMITSGDAGMFGLPYYVFPIGNFSYTWMNSRDMNMNDESTGWRLEMVNLYDFKEDDFKDTSKAFFSKEIWSMISKIIFIQIKI